MWNLKVPKTNQTKKPELMDIENILVVARGGGWGVCEIDDGSKGTNFQL